jgi:subtilase family serine protease
MKRTLLAGVLGLAAALLTAVSATATPAHPSDIREVCGPAAPGFARCFAEFRTDVATRSLATGAPTQGYGPAELRAAYHLPAAGGANQTVAIVDAGDDAKAEADLAVYRSTYGLPACTTANGCFHKVNQRGAGSPLPADWGWSDEISLDLDMVSAACSACHITLVESDSTALPDLATAENSAVALGANEVSNSFGGTEDGSSLAEEESAFRHPGVAIVASSGDNGYGVANTPAAFQSVVAVGGTSLSKANNARGWSEVAWSGASSGCSAWISKPTWQTDPNCPGRMVADVAADADPDTGPAVYDTADGPGWGVGGGTSASSPFIAGVIGLAADPGQFPNASYLYSHTRDLNDVVGGNNSGGNNSGGNNSGDADCGGDYQCNALPGYDGPTGLGTPNGIAAF